LSTRVENMTKRMSPAMAGKYARVARAPQALRDVVPAGELDRMIAAVDEWRELEMRVDHARTGLVRDLRKRGASWDSIGWLLGVTGAAVWKRFRADVPR
jgi:hypothetical protein